MAVTPQMIKDIEEALDRATILQQQPGDPPVILILPRSQVSDILAAPPPVDENGVADIGKSPAAGIEDPVPVLLFDGVEIRDTASHRPLESDALLDLRGARNWSFEIQNDHDQAVTVEVIGGSNRTPAGMGLLGISVAIAANTIEPIATDIWLPFMALQTSYSVQPASGSLTIRGFRQLFSR